MPAVWDAVVVGGGPAGVLAAERLLARGLTVLVVEAGPRTRGGQRPPEVDRRAWPFLTIGGTYDWYRVRALGGRSLAWGGWCHRFPGAVLRRGGWPYGAEALDPWYAEVEARLGVVTGELDVRYRPLEEALDVTVLPKRGAGLPADGAWTALSSPVARRARVDTVGVRLHHRAGEATALEVVDLRRDATVRIRARSFLLAASPIETARLLLSSELGRSARRVGRGFCDHLVASYVLLEPSPAPPPERRGAFPGACLLEAGVNQGPGTERPYPGGFCLELSGPTRLETLGLERMVRDDPAGWSATQIHAIGEGTPHPRRRVEIDTSQRDAAHRPVPRLRLAWSGGERRLAADLKQACQAVAGALSGPGARLIQFADPLQPGTGHEAGTCAMGADARAVCDPWGRMRGLSNVWVADASALPTPGDRHPTLTVLAHALRAAEAAGRWVSGHQAPRDP